MMKFANNIRKNKYLVPLILGAAITSISATSTEYTPVMPTENQPPKIVNVCKIGRAHV